MPRGKTKKIDIVETESQIEPEVEKEKVVCAFLPFTKSTYSTTDSEKKFGIYTNSIYTFPDFGVKKWVVHAYLLVDYDKYYAEGWTENRLIDGCLNYLNDVEKKKGAKKTPKPKYGSLEPLVSRWKGVYDLVYKPDRIIISLVTDDPKNINFWGEGT